MSSLVLSDIYLALERHRFITRRLVGFREIPSVAYKIFSEALSREIELDTPVRAWDTSNEEWEYQLHEYYEETIDSFLVDQANQSIVDNVKNNTAAVLNVMKELKRDYGYTWFDGVRAISHDGKSLADYAIRTHSRMSEANESTIIRDVDPGVLYRYYKAVHYGERWVEAEEVLSRDQEIFNEYNTKLPLKTRKSNPHGWTCGAYWRRYLWCRPIQRAC
jgi:hypothetical protein